jgi:hypothetical protein
MGGAVVAAAVLVAAVFTAFYRQTKQASRHGKNQALEIIQG